MTKDAILGLVRHVLTFGAGWLVAQNFVTASGAETAVGAIVALVGVAWSIFDKKKRATQ